ncbi:TetR/AcrR family transcriptional regulator [Rickettsiales bacterium LUAb2]
MNKKNQHILKVATKIFLELGFNNVSMDLIAKKAKVSKATVYAHFNSKDQLFLYCLDSYKGKHNTVYPSLPAKIANNLEELKQVLSNYLSQCFDYFTNEAYVDFLRVLIAELPTFPHLFNLYFAKNSALLSSNLADYLEQYYAKQNITTIHENIYMLGCNITDMLRGQTIFPILLKNPKRDIFLHNKQLTINLITNNSITLIKNL